MKGAQRIQKRQFAIYTFLIIDLVWPPKFSISIVINLFRDNCIPQEKLKTKVIQNSGGGGDKVNYRRCKNGEEWVAWQRRKNLLTKMFPRSLSSQLFRLFFFSILFLLRSRSHAVLLFELLYKRDKCRKNITKLQTLTVCDKNFNLKRAIYNKMHNRLVPCTVCYSIFINT